jgi:hypothetical protein
MRSMLATIFCFMQVVVSSEYPKPITLTVTKITRARKPTAACDNCGYVTTVEAYSATASFILVCESHMFPDKPKNNTVCTQFETGAHEARLLEADLISFWPEKSVSGPWSNHEDYSVVVEEVRPRELLN